MTNFVKESIDEALQATGYRLEEMSTLESVFFRKRVWDTLTDGKEHWCLWESAAAYGGFSIRESNAWEWLDEFLLLDEFYLFFDKDEDPTIYIFPQNQCFTKFQNEFPGYTFYITNKNLDFLIYQNDSDYLRCIGTAEPWLRNKAKELSKTGWVDMDGKSYL